jgi:flagellin-like protein
LGERVSIKINTKRIKRGLEPLIAAIILIAITLIIAIAVAAWITGVFSTSTGAGVEQLIIYPNTSLKRSGDNWIFNATLANRGTATIEIVGLTVGGCSPEGEVSPSIIEPGNITTITANFNASTCKFINGTTYQVQIFTAAGNVFSSTVVAGR